ncbi:MAG TPA: AI-2E family transporter [Microbacterium sp.]|uniref:AI-2E family transporter n=1 Tax=Microbacterium sp. TaxID=51671 RepID=UPI002B463305|nr:AI-2E family transporter [Microbacterium sp.]HKT58067.1 AI-2E family transporter [Microbacterium sp.]
MTDDSMPSRRRRSRLRRALGAAAPADADATVVIAQASASSPDHPRPVWMGLHNPFAVGFSLTLGGLVAFAVGVAFTNLSTVIIYVAFALFAALGLDPLVRWFERHSVSRAWGIVIVYAVFAVILVGVLLLIVPTVIEQVAQFIKTLPVLISDFQKTDLYRWLASEFGSQTSDIVKQVEGFLSNPSNLTAIAGGLLKVGAGIASGISGVVIVLVLSLYFLAGIPTMKKAFNRLWPARNRALAASMTDQITDSVGGYLGGMVVLAFCNAVVAFVLHLVLGLPFAALMGIVAFLITLIPLVGSVLYWALASVVALFSNPLMALVFAIIYLIYMQIEAYVLTPRVMNKTISVPGSLVVIGALVGGTLLGLLGALVAIPVTASVLLIIKQIVIPRQDAKL